jgi:ATP-dependent RNA helicase DDX6/DHH1
VQLPSVQFPYEPALAHTILTILSLSVALILVPTRELALQTASVCKELGKHLKVEVMVTTGGTVLTQDIMRLYTTIHLIVATPGRLLDLAKQGVAKLGNCKMFVMDEVSVTLTLLGNSTTARCV